VLGPALGGTLVHVGFWAPFVASAGIELINIGLTVAFLPSGGAKHQRNKIDVLRTAYDVWSLPRVRSLILQHFLFIFAVTFFFSIFALYLKQILDFGPTQASYLIALAGIVRALHYGWSSDHWQGVSVMRGYWPCGPWVPHALSQPFRHCFRMPSPRIGAARCSASTI